MERISYSSRCAIVVDLAKKLRERGSWCGETNLQKALYIVQDLARANFGYKFVIYKHGPYSFDFKSDLAAMRAANILQFQFPREGYGPSIVPTAFGERVYNVNKENIEQYLSLNNFLATWFAASDVRHLERVATAYYISTKYPQEPIPERARRLSALKPHVDIVSAEEAVRTVDDKRREAEKQLAALAA